MACTGKIYIAAIIILLIDWLAFSTKSYAFWWGETEYYKNGVHVPIVELVTAMPAGKVLFIDTREPEEFSEGRIPTAINVPLRLASTVSIAGWDKYQYIVPYCLKDFRGFEMLVKLREMGLTNVRMMEPAGFNGWRSLGYPIETAENENSTHDELNRLIER